MGADLHFLGPANQRRGRADSLSKIVFQHLARNQPITLEQLLEVAAVASDGAEGGGGEAAGALELGSLLWQEQMQWQEGDLGAALQMGGQQKQQQQQDGGGGQPGWGAPPALRHWGSTDTHSMSCATEGGGVSLMEAGTETDGIEVDGP